MNGSIGFIIFLIIAIVSAVKRHREAQEEEERRRSLPKTRPEDLPEATRRMLYGDTQVPTARERQEPAQPTVIVARPRQVFEQNEEGPRPVPAAPPVIPPPPRQAERPVRLPIPPRPMQPQRPVVVVRRAAPPTPPRPNAAMPPPSVARQVLFGEEGLDYDTRAAVEREDGEWIQRDRRERLRQAERAQGQATAQANTARKHRVFQAGTDLRRAILMNEILGPPVAMRDPFGPFQSGPSL